MLRSVVQTYINTNTDFAYIRNYETSKNLSVGREQSHKRSHSSKQAPLNFRHVSSRTQSVRSCPSTEICITAVHNINDWRCLSPSLSVFLRGRHACLLICRYLSHPSASPSVWKLPPAVCSSFLTRDRRSCCLSSRICCLLIAMGHSLRARLYSPIYSKTQHYLSFT